MEFLPHPVSRLNHSGTTSSAPKLQLLQWSDLNWGPAAVPSLPTTWGHKSKKKTLTKHKPVVQNQVTAGMKNLRTLHKKEQVPPEKIQAKVLLMRSMLLNQRAALQEFYTNEGFLSRLNQELIKTIQDTEDSTALNVRTLLQQQATLGNVINTLEHSNKNRVEQLRSELQEWEEKEESKTNNLHWQVEQLNAEIQKAQEEVSFLSTYMDHEYPVRLVQIANCIRQVEQAKNRQQDELDNLSEMRKLVLDSLSNTIQEKKANILRSLMVLIEQMKEEVSVLKADVEQLYDKIADPRAVVFKDVLLQRPKCTPDMAVELNIPVEEPLPF